jgi:hypothetical protein
VKRRVQLFLALGAILGLSLPTRAEQSGYNDGFEIYSDAKTGRVGLGTTQPLVTLDASQGEMKIGSTGIACTAQLAGTLRFADAKLQLCDGAGWRNVSLDKAK